MTSGTAVANLGPAVVEANYARVPLILLSANRPYELLGTGANQTIEQLGYFGTQLRTAVSLGLAEDQPRCSMRKMRRFDSMRKMRSGAQPPAGCLRQPPVRARPTPDPCNSTSLAGTSCAGSGFG